ncbi:FxSxx-COOH system tetratricopeptide repeat protein [Streptomyces sp. NBC_01356]|uniref:FxSxx-COOH system tetratricopeptide repeat protein n=1 Tax=Streptomyces sp. NBC_01356 TaxID=2903836 RepID=UPI002E30025B|nr:FxSxx-COOH system tetratricopeptide repeat protein [Streptomyces sp. NBC_01356]
MGFPRSEERDGQRDTKEIAGHIEALTGLKSGLITAHIDQVATASRPGTTSRWAGASGAALFCGKALTGVITTDRTKNYQADQLVAVPLAALAARPGFTATIKAAGNPLHLEEVTAASEHASPPRNTYAVDVPAGLHNLPDLPSDIFVGRDAALYALDEALGQDSKAITQTVQGLGGVGKSTLALHYARSHLDAYRLVWWIQADTADGIVTDLAALTTRIRGDSAKDLPATDAADWAIGWLQTHPGWLLVLDNAEHPYTVQKLTGQLHNVGRHLITSRYAHGWNTTPLALPLLDEAASLELLTRLTGLTDQTDQQQAQLLAEELGHLPLALEQAGAFMAQTRISMTEYRDLLAQHPGLTTDTPTARTRPHRTMARIWRITLDVLQEQEPLTVGVLRVAAWYAPTAIPRSLLAPLAGNPVRYNEALGLLANYNMITLDADAFGIHRLIQTIARTPDLADSTQADPYRAAQDIDAARDTATLLLGDALPEDPRDNVAGWPHWRTLLPHIQALIVSADPGEDSENTDALLYESTKFLQGQGLVAHAVEYSKRSLDASVRIHGHYHPDTLASRNNLASAYESAGDLGSAIPLYETTLADYARVLGNDHPHTLASRNNLAGAYRSAGDLGRAIPLFETALADYTRVLGNDHPDTLTSRNNLASAYRSAGDLGRAIPLFETSLADRTRVLGNDHPDTLASRNNLAYGYESAGDLGRAIPLFETSLADYTRVLGNDHPHTLASRNNLAYAYRSAGDLGRAIPLYETALADYTRVLGNDHPDTLASRNNLAGAYESAGDLGRAIPLFETALADRTRVLGNDHPDTLGSRNNLAGVYRSAGDLGRAIPLYETALADATRVLGNDHPDTLASRNNLAGAYESAGDLGRAIPLYETTFADVTRVLGNDHPHTLTSRNNLAGAYRSAGDLSRAIPLYETTLADRTRVLGNDHPHTLTSRNNLAGAYRSAGDLSRAIPLYETTLADRTRVLGNDHPDTLTSRNNLAGAYESAGDLGRAIPLFETTLADRTRVLGNDHPDTLTSRNNLAGAYESAGDLSRAIPLYETTFADVTRILGNDHPHTLTSRNNLAYAYRSAGDLSRAIPLYESAFADSVRIHGDEHPTTRIIRGNLIGAYLERL